MVYKNKAKMYTITCLGPNILKIYMSKNVVNFIKPTKKKANLQGQWWTASFRGAKYCLFPFGMFASPNMQLVSFLPNSVK